LAGKHDESGAVGPTTSYQHELLPGTQFVVQNSYTGKDVRQVDAGINVVVRAGIVVVRAGIVVVRAGIVVVRVGTAVDDIWAAVYRKYSIEFLRGQR
jgi:hypothetical protein